jgi:hypothetical protein
MFSRAAKIWDTWRLACRVRCAPRRPASSHLNEQRCTLQWKLYTLVHYTTSSATYQPFSHWRAAHGATAAHA